MKAGWVENTYEYVSVGFLFVSTCCKSWHEEGGEEEKEERGRERDPEENAHTVKNGNTGR